MTAPAQSPAGADVMAAFADPNAIGGTRPAVRDMVGRIVVIKPTRFEERVPGVEAGTFQDRVTADVLVLDGGPMEFGGNPARGKPQIMKVETPYLVKGMYISNTNIVDAVKEQTGRGVVLGRVTVGRASNPMHNPPYNLVTLEGDDPMRAAAGQVYTKVLNNTFVNPEPVKIGAAPVAQAAAAAVVDPEYAAWKAQQAAQAAAAGQPAAPVETAEQAAQRKFAEWQAQEAAKAAPTAPVEEIPPAPTGWDATMWATLKPEQRQKVLDGTPPFK